MIDDSPVPLAARWTVECGGRLADRGRCEVIACSHVSTHIDRILQCGNDVLALEDRMIGWTQEGAPPNGCPASIAMGDSLGKLAYQLAASNIVVSLDHLRTVAQAVGTGILPAYALMSLIRTGHECALAAEWLMEPSIGEEGRISRGLAAQLDDFEERKKFEDSVGASRAEVSSGKSAERRIVELLSLAEQRDLMRSSKDGTRIPLEALAGGVRLFELFKSGDGQSGAWLYRYYSGFAHGKRWAVTSKVRPVGSADRYGHLPGVVEIDLAEVELVMRLSTVAVGRAVRHFAALRHHEAGAPSRSDETEDP